MKFNLILSTFRNREGDAVREFRDLIQENLGENPLAEISDVRGVVIALTKTDPLEVIDLFKSMVTEEPWHFRYLLRVIPVEMVCSTNLTEIVVCACHLFQRVSKASSFKILVERRFSNINSREVISAIASRITNKVDLDDPDWVVVIEILGKKTGISVSRPEHLLSIVKEKMGFHRSSNIDVNSID
ncbi:MAG: THUMP domain-containing protein [Thermoproteota archaeon]|nr:THUMP domain-containing protein [Thermoproteota archaeon]